MSPRDMYYRFYKISPGGGDGDIDHDDGQDNDDGYGLNGNDGLDDDVDFAEHALC